MNMLQDKEHIMLSGAKNNILFNEQHDFSNKLSIITQLINTTNDWTNTLSNKGQADNVFWLQ